MGRKLNQASKKICKSENTKQLNGLIKNLRPKVYITKPRNFKNLVQQLTGNTSNINPFNPPFIQEPIMEIPIINIENSLESSFDSSKDSLPSCYSSLANSPQSMPSAFTSLPSSPQEEGYVPQTTYNVLKSSFESNDNYSKNMPSNFGDIESWLLEFDSVSCNWDAFNDHIPSALPELSISGSDFANLW